MKTMAAILTLALAAGFAPALCSAQQTIPDGFLTTPGFSYTNYPFGFSSQGRVQYLYDKSLAKLPATPIRELAVRGHANQTGTPKTVELEIRLSSSSKAFDGASTSFATNSGNDEVVVFTKKMVKLPGYASSATPTFVTTFKLDKTFIYLTAKGNLLIDYVMTQSAAGAYPTNVVWSKGAQVSSIGSSCKSASQSVVGGSSLNTSSTLAFNLSNAPANGAAVHILGFQKLAQSVPLPNGACPLEIAPFLVFGVATTASGTASAVYPIPVGTRSVTGPVVYGQWVALGTTWDSSNANEVILGGYLPCVRIYNTSNASATTGSVQIGAGIVHRIQ